VRERTGGKFQKRKRKGEEGEWWTWKLLVGDREQRESKGLLSKHYEKGKKLGKTRFNAGTSQGGDDSSIPQE